MTLRRGLCKDLGYHVARLQPGLLRLPVPGSARVHRLSDCHWTVTSQPVTPASLLGLSLHPAAPTWPLLPPPLANPRAWLCICRRIANHLSQEAVRLLEARNLVGGYYLLEYKASSQAGLVRVWVELSVAPCGSNQLQDLQYQFSDSHYRYSAHSWQVSG